MAIEKERIEVKLSFRFDAFLLRVIQDVTKRPSAEILNFFNELGKQVANIGTEQRKGSGIRKNITDYFPNTSIPFRLIVKGDPRGPYRKYDLNKKAYTDEEIPAHMNCEVEVGFPFEGMGIETQKLDDIAVQLMEQALLGGEEVAMPPFARPEIRTPKMYKPLMDAFAGREPAKSKKRKKKGEQDE
jgi:hypothetical protein